MILYGIPTCDTCRKARKSLEAAGHIVQFRDIRKEPLSTPEWRLLLDAFGEDLVNRRSTTWRGLDEATRAAEPLDLLASHPSLMKRPVCEDGERRTIGWDPTARAMWLGE